MQPTTARSVAPFLALFASGSATAQEQTSAKFADLFEIVDRVQLVQTERVLVADPRFSRDPLGGWIVVDVLEGQVRLRDHRGRLKAYFGRRGEGPGEFTNLARVLRAKEGDLVSVDMSGRFGRWSADGSKLLGDFRLPLIGITGAEWVGEDTILVVTPPRFPPGAATGPILHLVDLATESLVRSYYEPAIADNARNAWSTFVGGGVSASEGYLGVTMPLLDTLLVFDTTDRALGRIPLGVLAGAASIPDARIDRTAFREWTRTLTLVGPVFASPSAWLIPLLPVGMQQNTVDMLHISLEGGEVLLVRGSPALLGANDVTGVFVFDDPDQLEPQYVLMARLREDVR